MAVCSEHLDEKRDNDVNCSAPGGDLDQVKGAVKAKEGALSNLVVWVVCGSS